MSFKPKSHKGMGDEEWMARLKAFARDGVWPSNAGNRPAPRQKKWHALYQKIEKCPIQSWGQTTLFGVSATCDCGLHAAKPPPPPVAPQSVASKSTSYAPRSFLRSSPSLSMFIKSRFGGSHMDSLKPNLVARKPPGPSLPSHLEDICVTWARYAELFPPNFVCTTSSPEYLMLTKRRSQRRRRRGSRAGVQTWLRYQFVSRSRPVTHGRPVHRHPCDRTLPTRLARHPTPREWIL
ncbi:hypothetical protein GOODEAATRI_012846 [Goodea atripinnis]|uniref:Uncharacterized protein n=1 Tax=Goodea atripinnis TaxID=208336 RepID=A0ABV0MJB8_9TELE